MSSSNSLSHVIDEHARRQKSTDIACLSCLEDILRTGQLNAVFQPIISMSNGQILGYEGFVRGPVGGPLHAPADLFRVARANSLTSQVEIQCCCVILEKFSELKLPAKLFLNISPAVLIQIKEKHEGSGYLRKIGLAPSRVVLELTESHYPLYNYGHLRLVVAWYRNLGFEIAIDDLGEGFSSLRRWSELHPEYIKIDMHFIQGIDIDALKQQFVLSIQQIAHKSGAIVIAEGIETQEQLAFLAKMGVAYGQGFFIAYPSAQPIGAADEKLSRFLAQLHRVDDLAKAPFSTGVVNALSLLRSVPVVSPDMTNNQVYDVFSENPRLNTMPVVFEGVPQGVVTRASLIDRFARPYQRELYGKKPCTLFMDARPLIADKETSLQKLSSTLVEADQHRLISDFIITDKGRYLGIGTSHDLLRELTKMQIKAAKYANPLTLLPGNVPINQHIEYLLQASVEFSACYADLDNFKPFNDVFGYKKGDDVIQLTGKVLSEHVDPECDFLGHIGGDDFIILFQSADWEARCEGILNAFSASLAHYLDRDDSAASGYFSEDRAGKRQFYPLPSLSLGVVMARPWLYDSHHQIAAAATDAKAQAKKTPGNSLFVERRKYEPLSTVGT